MLEQKDIKEPKIFSILDIPFSNYTVYKQNVYDLQRLKNPDLGLFYGIDITDTLTQWPSIISAEELEHCLVSPLNKPQVPEELTIVFGKWIQILWAARTVQNNIRRITEKYSVTPCVSYQFTKEVEILDTIFDENGYFALFIENVDKSLADRYRATTLTYLQAPRMQQESIQPTRLIALGQLIRQLGAAEMRGGQFIRTKDTKAHILYNEIVKHSLCCMEEIKTRIALSLAGMVRTYRQFKLFTKLPSHHVDFANQESSQWIHIGIDSFIFTIDRPETLALLQPKCNPMETILASNVKKACLVGLILWMFQKNATENPLLFSVMLVLLLGLGTKIVENRHRLSSFFTEDLTEQAIEELHQQQRRI